MSTDTAIERAGVWLAALVCLLFALTLRDTPGRAVWRPQSDAPPLPADVGERVASLEVTVRQGDAPAEGVTVRVFSVIGDQVYRAGLGVTGPDGKVRFDELPTGETWILAEREGLARTSRRMVLEGGLRSIEMSLEAAEAFEVVVVDPLQRPIRGVHVALYSTDPLEHRTMTDGRGLARFTSLPGPPYAVEVMAKGYDPKFFPKLTLEDSPLFVKMTRLGGLEIRVVGADKEPVPGAKVLVAGSSLWPARSTDTDDEGRVTISGLSRGFYELRAQKGNLVSDEQAGVLLAEGEVKEVELTLVEGLYVTVRVTDGAGDDAPGIDGADVSLVEGGLSSFPLYGRTVDGGQVTLGPIAGVDATVSARARGFVGRAVALEEGETEVRIALLRGGVILGEVVDEDDFPVDGAQLEVVGVDLDGMPIAESGSTTGFAEDHFAFALPGATPLVPAGELGVMPVVPDIPREISGGLLVTPRTGTPWISGRNGDFRLEPVTPGGVQVVARHPNYVEGMSEVVQLAPGGEAQVRIVLRHGGVLEGRVVEIDGTPVGGARIEVAAVLGSLERITFTADDGTFAFAALPEDIVLSVARGESPERVVERLWLTIPPGGRSEIQIVLPEPREPVKVRVTDDRGYPVDGVEIHCSSLEPAVPFYRTLFTDDAGEAQLEDARGLPLRLVLRRRGLAPGVYEIDRASAVIDLVMIPPLTAIGRVVTRSGSAEDAEIALLTPTGVRGARTNEDGEFRLEDLAPTRAVLRVVMPGWVAQEIEVEIEGDPRREVDLGKIELEEGGSVRGVVVDERGDPVVGARIAEGRVPTYLPLGPLPLGVTATDSSGRFVLADLPAGKATIEAYRMGYARTLVDVKIRAGQSTPEVRIELVEDEEEVSPIGAQASLAVTLSESDDTGRNVVTFEHVPAHGEAERAGILPGDRFLRCNGYAVRTLEAARGLLTGPISEDMVLELGRDPDLVWRVRVKREKLRR